MIFGSVCSGIEAASVAWHPLGWRAAFVSEIERFPSAVLAHHYSDVPNLGDMTRFQEWPDAAIDVLVGGTPCQSFSVAGLRKGLSDPRGNLALVYLALADRYRPEWLVWENVPGVLSSAGGRDFGAFLGALGELGYGFAYRVLDAQFYGVAQRRRRVFVVANSRDWRRAAAVLFERHSLSGHLAPRRETGEGSSGGAGGGITKRRWPADVAATLNAAFGSKQGLEDQHALGGGSCSSLPPVAQCLTTGTGLRYDPETETLIPTIGGGFDAVAFSCKDHGADAGLIAPTLRSMGHDGSHANGGGQVAVAFGWQNSSAQGDDVRVEHSPTLDKSKTPAVAFDLAQITSAANRTRVSPELPSSTLAKDSRMHVATSMAVRRFTPRECERLQGFPDDYTLIPWRIWQEAKRKGAGYESLLAERGMKLREPAGEECPDGPRYKALGNSMAVPVMRWIGERIAAVAASQVEAA